MLLLWGILGIYCLLINIVAAVAAAVDKRRARRQQWRISEATLLGLGALGGAGLEWITMRILHHKTTRKKFMLGLPLFFVLHLAILGGLLWLTISVS